MPSFSIVSPQPNNQAFIVGGAVIVTINDNSGGTETYSAKLFPFVSGSGAGAQIGPNANFTAVGTTSQMTASLPDASITGPPPANNNRAVLVEQQSDGSGLSWAFKLGIQGSGSSGSGRPQLKLKFCRPGQLVPVALSLNLDSKVTKGTCAKCAELNRSTLLLHTADAACAGTWVSRPIAFCGKSAPAGYWVLERNSATAWTLVLRQGDKVIVTYTATTKPKDCSLPIKLQRKGAGNKVCKAWPKTITISPAL